MASRYRDSLAYLYSLQLFGIKLGLRNIRELLKRVGQPQQGMRIVHIAGTNGKGSTAAALAAVLHSAGIRSGLYTSPHLHSFTERVRIDTRQIDEAEVVSLIEELRPHAEELQATFFEFTTALALLSFRRHEVDWAILETGMGGRLDATNVVLPELCVITPIACDHMAHLGSDLAEIAAEKAGIFKPGVPVLCAGQSPAAEAVLHLKAADLQLSLWQMGRDYHWSCTAGSLQVSGPGLDLTGIRPALAGEHQCGNLALAAAACACLAERGLPLDNADIKTGLERVRWPGRLEWLSDRILLDGAHNPDGARVLADFLRRQGLTGLQLIVGCKGDKQWRELLALLLPFAARVYATRPPVGDTVAPEKLVQQARESGILAEVYADPATALAAARRNQPAEGIILAAGSLFLVAAVREAAGADCRCLKIVD